MTVDSSTVGSLVPKAFAARLRREGIGVRVGPFDLHLRVRVRSLAEHLWTLYRDYPLLDGARVFTCHVTLDEVRSLRCPWRRNVRLLVDGRPPHEDMPAEHALAVLEWGVNLVIAMRHQGYMMLHAAVVERGGRAMVLPASPGHGKSTLAIALAHRGWRLLSDEFGLLRPGTSQVLPVPRLVPLKNESIGLLRRFAPEATIGPEIAGTRKGTVAHVRPPGDSVARAHEAAPVGWIVFPRWEAGAPLGLEPINPVPTFMKLATNAFNYELLGESGFATVRKLVDSAPGYQLAYSDLDGAVAALSRLADHAPA